MKKNQTIALASPDRCLDLGAFSGILDLEPEIFV